MADIDPHWRDVKLRLMRARGLAQNATVNTWGTVPAQPMPQVTKRHGLGRHRDRKSTRLNSSHQIISYAVFCLKKKKIERRHNIYVRYVRTVDVTSAIPTQAESVDR